MGSIFSSSADSDDDSTPTTLISESKAGAQILRLEGFSKMKRMGVGHGINSNTFTVGGHSWYVRCYPDGSWQDCAGWISLFLVLDRIADDWKGAVRAKFRFTLLDQLGKPVPGYQLESGVTSFFSAVDGWPKYYRGYTMFGPSGTLERRYLTEDVLRIHCDVTVVIKESGIGISTVRPPVPPLASTPPDMHHHFGDLLASKVGTDVTFWVGGEQFPAHRIVLIARSPVFRAELLGHMKQKQMAHIRIDEMDASVCRTMLHFIYTDSLPDLDERHRVATVQHLIVSADRYDLVKLKFLCTQMLLCDLDATNVATTLVLAEQHGFEELKEGCLRFLKNIGLGNVELMVSDGFQQLRSRCPSLFEEVFARPP